MISKLKKLGLLYRFGKVLHVKKKNTRGYLTHCAIYNYNGIGFAKEAYYCVKTGTWRPDKDHNKLKKEMHLWL